MSFIVITLIVLYNRYTWEIKVWLFAHQCCLWLVNDEEIDKHKIYDAFVSYSHKDEDIVIPELVEKLENIPHPYKLCLHFRNWLPGELISNNIMKSVEESRRTIVILSKNSIQSEWAKMEFRAAYRQSLVEKGSRVIIVLLGEIPWNDLDEEIKAYLSLNTYLKWGEPWFWDKIRYGLPHWNVKQRLNIQVKT